jgi:hypothetical protein
MDMAFLHRADRMLAHGEPARIDHSMLVATLAAQRQAQAAIRTRPAAVAAYPPSDEPLVELLLGGPSRHQALAAQRGCFSRAEAGRKINVL